MAGKEPFRPKLSAFQCAMRNTSCTRERKMYDVLGFQEMLLIPTEVRSNVPPVSFSLPRASFGASWRFFAWFAAVRMPEW